MSACAVCGKSIEGQDIHDAPGCDHDGCGCPKVEVCEDHCPECTPLADVIVLADRRTVASGDPMLEWSGRGRDRG